jgi:hypothetical protein
MPTRDFEHDGQRWQVRELDASHVPGARSDRCLICESTEVIRRLWSYPNDWVTLDDQALFRLCDEAPMNATPTSTPISRS